jgi:hypothetical protein
MSLGGAGSGRSCPRVKSAAAPRQNLDAVAAAGTAADLDEKPGGGEPGDVTLDRPRGGAGPDGEDRAGA